MNPFVQVVPVATDSQSFRDMPGQSSSPVDLKTLEDCSVVLSFVHGIVSKEAAQLEELCYGGWWLR